MAILLGIKQGQSGNFT